QYGAARTGSGADRPPPPWREPRRLAEPPHRIAFRFAVRHRVFCFHPLSDHLLPLFELQPVLRLRRCGAGRDCELQAHGQRSAFLEGPLQHWVLHSTRRTHRAGRRDRARLVDEPESPRSRHLSGGVLSTVDPAALRADLYLHRAAESPLWGGQLLSRIPACTHHQLAGRGQVDKGFGRHPGAVGCWRARPDLPCITARSPGRAVRVGKTRRRRTDPSVLAHHAPIDHTGDPLRPYLRHDPGPPDLHAGLHPGRRHERRRRLHRRARELAALLCLLPVQERLPVQRYGVCLGHGLGALRDQHRARGSDHAVVPLLGALRGRLMTVARELREAPRVAVERMPTPRAPLFNRLIPQSLYVRVGLVLACVFFLLPFYWMANSALKSTAELSTFPPTLLPQSLRFENFVNAVNYIPFGTFLLNSVILTAGISIGAAISNPLIAYGFSRIKWPGRDFVFGIVMATIFLPFPVLIVALFDIFAKLHWIDTFVPMIVPAFFGSPLFIFLMRQFYLALP